MLSPIRIQHSLKTRITLSTLGVFLIGIWSLTIYISQMLQDDMQTLLSEQQFATVSFVAADINVEVAGFLNTLEEVAGGISPALLGNKAALQTFLEARLNIQRPFNGGVMVHRLDGTVIAGVRPAGRRTGVNYMDKDHVGIPLTEGKPMVGKPRVSKSGKLPEFTIAIPLRDAQGKVTGALAGVIDLSGPNFLDKITESRYGKTGGYLLIAPQHRLIVTASDKSRIMERLPDSGINPVTDRFDRGYEGTAIMVNSQGVEVLVSAKRIPVAGWILAAILPTVEAFAPVRAMQRRMLVSALFLTMLVAGLTWLILRRQLAPMLASARMLRSMSDRDGGLQALPVIRQDELGQLVSGFNRLLSTVWERERALRESESLLSDSQIHAGLGSYVLDVPSGVWKCSAVLDALFGIDETYEHSVEGWVALIHPDDREMIADYFRNEVLGQGRAFDKVYRINRRNDGAERWVYGLGKTEFDDHGRPLRMHGTIQDITERKQAEDALRESHRELRDLASSLQTVREEERTALARELHDELGQQLLRLRMDLSWLEGRIRVQAPELHEKVETMKHFIDGSVASLRHLTTELRLPLLDDLGLTAAALWVLDDFSQRTGVEVVSDIAIDDTELEERVKISIFRILQESLTNIARHAAATQVNVSLTRTAEGLALDIRDNGCGTELRDKPKLGHGLIGIRERTLLLGGTMEISSSQGAGFAIRIRIPLATVVS